jgi:hypothetical protein
MSVVYLSRLYPLGVYAVFAIYSRDGCVWTGTAVQVQSNGNLSTGPHRWHGRGAVESDAYLYLSRASAGSHLGHTLITRPSSETTRPNIFSLL